MSYFHKFVKFSKATVTISDIAKNYLPLFQTNRWFAEKNRLKRNTGAYDSKFVTLLYIIMKVSNSLLSKQTTSS